jgi:HSF-type DNA-binding
MVFLFCPQPLSLGLRKIYRTLSLSGCRLLAAHHFLLVLQKAKQHCQNHIIIYTAMLLTTSPFVDLDLFGIMDEGEGTYDHDLALKKQSSSSSSPKDLSYLPEAVAPPPLLASDQRVQGRPSGRRNRREEGKNQDLLSNLKLPFPWKLYQLLEEVGSSLAHIVSWMGDNNFRVHDPEAFVAHVMPKFFRMSKYQSFTRQCKCCQQKTKASTSASPH